MLPTIEVKRCLLSLKQDEAFIIKGLSPAQKMFINGAISMFSCFAPCILQTTEKPTEIVIRRLA